MTDDFNTFNIQEELRNPENQLVGWDCGDQTRKRLEELIQLTEEILPSVIARKRKYFQTKFDCWKTNGGKIMKIYKI